MSYNRTIKVFGDDNLLPASSTLGTMYAGEYVYADTLNTAFYELSTVSSALLYLFGLDSWTYEVEDDRTASTENYKILTESIKDKIKLENITSSGATASTLRLTVGDLTRNVTITTATNADVANRLDLGNAAYFANSSGFNSVFTKTTTSYGVAVELNTVNSVSKTDNPSSDQSTVPTMSVIRKLLNSLTIADNTDSITIEYDDTVF